MKKEAFADLCSMLLVVMFLYASFSKYFDWNAYHRAMFAQPFSHDFTVFLMLTIPPVEIITSVLLMFSRTRMIGLVASLALMLSFTIYIGAILGGLFPKVPCSCGGIIRAMGWRVHLWFNIFFTLLSLTGVLLQKKQTNKSGVGAI